MSEKEWLAGLKAGDEVGISGGWTPRRAVVSSATATRIRVGGDEYQRTDGRSRGHARGMIFRWTEEHEREERDRLALSRLRGFSWSDVSADVRARVCAILDEAKKVNA